MRTTSLIPCVQLDNFCFLLDGHRLVTLVLEAHIHVVPSLTDLTDNLDVRIVKAGVPGYNCVLGLLSFKEEPHILFLMRTERNINPKADCVVFHIPHFQAGVFLKMYFY